MSTKTSYESLEQSSPEARKLLRQEEFILRVTEALCEALEKTGVKQTDLAGRLKKSDSFVSQVLAGDRNLTLRTLADVADALDLEPDFILRVKDAKGVTTFIGETKWHTDKRDAWVVKPDPAPTVRLRLVRGVA